MGMRAIKANLARGNTTAIITSNGTALAANGDRVGGLIQNLSTVPLYVHLGSGCDFTSTNFTYILPGGAAANDGTGGSFTFEGWLGVVSVKAATGTPSCVVAEFIG